MIFWFSKSLRRKPLNIAGPSGENLALPHFLGQPLEQRIGIDDRLDDGGRRAGHADRFLVDPIGCDGLGESLTGQFAQPEQDRPVTVE